MKYLNELIYRVTELVFEQLINEARFEVLKQKYAMKLLDFLHATDEQSRTVKLMISGDERDGWFGYKKGDQKDAEELFSWFGDIDPTDNKKYVEWLIRGILSKKTTWEKLYTTDTLDLLTKFEKIKKAVPGTDINRMSLDDLEIFVEENEDATSSRQLKSSERRKIEKEFYYTKQAILLHSSDKFKVVVPLTHKASCFFGEGTKWCTTSRNNPSTFDEYSETGRLYVVLDRAKKSLFQLHFPEKEFRNATNETINIVEFLSDKPELVKVLSGDREVIESMILKALGPLPDPIEEAKLGNFYSLLNRKATKEYVKSFLDSIIKTNLGLFEDIYEPGEAMNNTTLTWIIEHIGESLEGGLLSEKRAENREEVVKTLTWVVFGREDIGDDNGERDLVDLATKHLAVERTHDVFERIAVIFMTNFLKKNQGAVLPRRFLPLVLRRVLNGESRGSFYLDRNFLRRFFEPYASNKTEQHELEIITEILKARVRQGYDIFMKNYHRYPQEDTGVCEPLSIWLEEFKFVSEFYSKMSLPEEDMKRSSELIRTALEIFEENTGNRFGPTHRATAKNLERAMVKIWPSLFR